jgi:hypothetical protein
LKHQEGYRSEPDVFSAMLGHRTILIIGHRPIVEIAHRLRLVKEAPLYLVMSKPFNLNSPPCPTAEWSRLHSGVPGYLLGRREGGPPNSPMEKRTSREASTRLERCGETSNRRESIRASGDRTTLGFPASETKQILCPVLSRRSTAVSKTICPLPVSQSPRLYPQDRPS